MSLSSDLISKFVEITNDKPESKKETIVYGTIVLKDGSKYVKMDGSDLLTPISSTTDVEDGERVTVMIKDHSAIVTGNISSPSARTSTVQALEGTVDNVKSDSDANAIRVNDAQLAIDSLKTTISTLVTGQNGESLMTQTENGWTFSMASVLNTLNSANQSIANFENDLSIANNAIDILNGNVTDLSEYTNYIKFSVDEGAPCIILGETDSNFKVVITNTNIRFMEGSSIPAYISNQALNIGDAVINGELRQGGFAWVARSNGNYGLVWKGV